MKKTILAATLAAIALPAAPALADPPAWAPAHGYREHRGDNRYENRSNNGYYAPYQYRRGYDRRLSYNDRVWRGNDNRYYCRRNDGTTGLVVGAGLGALAGSAIASNRDQALGIILGGVAGGVAGRSIERNSNNYRCR